MGYGAPDTNRNYHERAEGPRVWVTRTGDKACNRGAPRVTQEPRIVLGMFAPNSGTKVGVVSDGELDGNDGAPVVVETVQVGAERAVSVIAVVVNRGSTSSTTTATPGLLFVSSSGGASVASDRSRTQVVRYNRRVVADLRCGRTAEMAWSCRKCCWLRSRPHAEYVYWAVSRTRQCLGTGGERWRRFGVGGVR